MDFYIADSITTLLTVSIFAVIFLVFFKRGLRQSYFYLWTMGWALTLLHYLAQVIGSVSPVELDWAFFMDRLLLAFSVVVFFHGARELFGLKTRKDLLAALGALFLLFSYLQIYHPVEAPKILKAPSFQSTLMNFLGLMSSSKLSVLLGAVLLSTGLIFFRHRKKCRMMGVLVLAYAFTFWGVGFLSLPFILRWEYFMPLIAQLLNLPKPVVVVGMIIYLFEHEKLEAQKHRDDAIQQRDFNQRLMENASDAIFLTDRDGKFRWVNKECERLLGLSSKDLSEKSGCEFVDAADRNLLKQATPAVLSGKFQSLEVQIQNAHQEICTVQVSLSPIRDTQDQITGVLGMGRDVTDRRAMERQLRHSEKLMALGRLIAGAAHELNNPLTTVMGFSELSLQDATLDPKLRQRFERILQAAVRSKNIVEGLQNFVRVPEHAVELMGANDLVMESLSPLEAEFRAGQINVRLRFGNKAMPISVNRARMVQVIQSILKNAAEAIRETKPGGTVTISTGLEGENVAVAIADDGPGIKEPDRVFEPFYTTKEVGKGTGMALSVSYSIVQHYGGKIVAENNSKGGATFRILLPFTPAGSDSPSTAATMMSTVQT